MSALTLALSFALSATATAEPIGYAVNSDDQRDADRLMRIDLRSGRHEFVGELPSVLEDVEGIAFAPDGTLFAVDSATRTLVRVSTSTASAQAVDGRAGNLGFSALSSFDFGLTFTCDGRLLLAAEQTQSLYSVDPDSGAARLIGASGGLGDAVTALASFEDEVYGLAAVSGNFYLIDPDAGTSSLVGTISDFEITDAGIAFDAGGTLWAISSDFSFDDSRVFTIDPDSARITLQAGTRPGVESLAIEPPTACRAQASPVPVPAVGPVGLGFLAGLMLLLGSRARRRGAP